MTYPKISIVTVALNAEKTIADTLNSVAAQTHDHLEHVVVDGQSFDKTMCIVRANAHHRMKFVSEPDTGLYDAMNKGVQLSTGDYVGFLNADDFFCRTDAVSLLARAIQSCRSDAICGAVAIVDPHNLTAIKRSYSATCFSPWQIRCGHMPPHPGFYVRRDLIAAPNGFDSALRIGGDFEWMVRFFLRHKASMHALPETIVTQRAGGISARGFQSMLTINREAAQSLKRHKIASHPVMLWSRYLVKWLQLINAPYAYPPPEPIVWAPVSTANH